MKKKAKYSDSLPTQLPLATIGLIAEPLALIINQSLNTGIFPDKFKFTKITPIYKKDNKHFTENYRPISLLPSISKLFERVVYDQIYSYFIKYNYFCPN